MSALTQRLIEATARKLTAEARQLRNRADTHPNESISMFLRRRSWTLTGKARQMLEVIAEL